MWYNSKASPFKPKRPGCELWTFLVLKIKPQEPTILKILKWLPQTLRQARARGAVNEVSDVRGIGWCWQRRARSMRIGLDGFLCATDLLMIHAAHHCHPIDLLPEYCLELIFQQINTPNLALVMILRPITSPLKPSFRVVDGVACLVHRGAIWQVAHVIHKDGPGQRRSLVKTAWTFATNI